MAKSQIILLVTNVIGGLAVLGSYVYGLSSHPGQGKALWGAIPSSMQNIYTVSMFIAAISYFAFLYQTAFRMVPQNTLFPFGLPFETLIFVYVIILLPSSLWMSLTFNYISAPSEFSWLLTRLVLAAVGLGSLTLFGLLASLHALAPNQAFWPGTVGAFFFSFHTLILDAVVWPIYFRH